MSAPYRHAAHLDDAPTRGQVIGRRIAAALVGIALVGALGLAGSSDLDAACADQPTSTSTACR